MSLLLGAGACGGADGGNLSFGGTQDIGLFRQLLAEGQIPGAATLDSNGFFSEHSIENPPPDCSDLLCPSGMLAVGKTFVAEADLTLVGLGLVATVDASDLDPAPLDLAVVIDTSGSMAADNKITYVKAGLRTLLGELRAEDRFALITYSTQAQVLQEMSPLDASTLASLDQRIDELAAAGATDMYAGLEAGFLATLQASEPGRELRVLLLSDGRPTVGIISGAAIEEMATGFVHDGVGMSTIGVGTDVDMTLLENLALIGNGSVYFLEDAQAIEEVFVDELDYFMHIIAYDLRIEVKPSPAYRILAAYGWTYTLDSYLNTVQIDIPSISLASRDPGEDPDPQGGRRGGGGNLFVTVVPNELVHGEYDPQEVVTIDLHYRTAETSEYVSQTITVRSPLAPGEIPDSTYASHPAMEKGWAMFNLYTGLRQACYTAGYNYHCALKHLGALEEAGAAWNAGVDDADIVADLELIDMFIDNLEVRGGDAAECEVPQSTGCNAAGSNGAPLVITLLLALLGMRRQRRRLS